VVWRTPLEVLQSKHCTMSLLDDSCLLIQLYTRYSVMVRFSSQNLALHTGFPQAFYVLFPSHRSWCSHTQFTTNYEGLCYAIFSIHLLIQ
jgi:hypothetical protein